MAPRRQPLAVGLLLLACCVVLVAAQPPIILPPGIQGVPEYINPGFPVEAFINLVDPLFREMSISWTLTDPRGRVVQTATGPSPTFVIEGSSSLPPRHGEFKLEVTVSAPRPSDTPGLTSDAADVTSASYTFRLANLPPHTPVIRGINTAGDETNGGSILELDGCGGVLALFASEGNPKRPLQSVVDPEGDRDLFFVWEVVDTSGEVVLAIRPRDNPLLLLHTGDGPADRTVPPGTYTVKVTVIDSPPAGYTPMSSFATSQQFTINSCPNYFGINLPGVIAAVIHGVPSVGEVLEPVLGLVPDIGLPDTQLPDPLGHLHNKTHEWFDKDKPGHGGGYGGYGYYYGGYDYGAYDPGMYYGGTYYGGGGYYGGGYSGGYYYGSYDPEPPHGKDDKKDKLFSLVTDHLLNGPLASIASSARLPGDGASVSSSNVDGTGDARPLLLPNLGAFGDVIRGVTGGEMSPFQATTSIFNTIIRTVLQNALPEQVSQLLDSPLAALAGPVLELAGNAVAALGPAALPALSALGTEGGMIVNPIAVLAGGAMSTIEGIVSSIG